MSSRARTTLWAAIALLAVSTPARAELESVYAAANRCLTLRAIDGSFVARSGEGYTAGAFGGDAARFYAKPTGLGSYLFLSAYSRAPGELGSKELLGISDPLGELLDDAGKFVGDVGILTAALGDMADFAVDPVAPAGRVVRQLGENVGEVGERVGDQNIQPALAAVGEASDLAVWRLGHTQSVGGSAPKFILTSRVTGQQLLLGDGGGLGLASPSTAGDRAHFELLPVDGCDAYPEAETGAELVGDDPPVRYWTEREGGDQPEVGDPVFGWADVHSHITAYEFIGGRVNYGQTFHEFGVDHALGDCAENHGPNGLTGTVEMFTSDDATGGHETQGWPTYDYWPDAGSLQHHQSYYTWLERAFLAGQKILVNLITHNEILCQGVPQKKNDCDGMANIRLQAQRTYEIQEYVDAQSGGPGKGWFRVVGSPAEARRVIDDGKLAVVLGVEMSKVLNCGEFLGLAECTRDQMRERLAEIHDLGVRVFFPVHKFDNAFGGHLPHSGFGFGTLLVVGNLLETGHPLEVEECPAEFSGDDREPDLLGLPDYLLWQLEYAGRQLPSDPAFAPYDPRSSQDTDLCNVRGLHDLGEVLIEELMAHRMVIDVDHMSRRAATRVIDVTSARGYPVISSHDWTGTEHLLDRVLENGGFIGRFARGDRSRWIERLLGMRDRYVRLGVDSFIGGGLASDVNGMAHLPPDPRPEGDTRTLDYPFLSYDGRVRFDKQVTGDRTFGLYDGRGVAHYGLYADFVADAAAFGGPQATEGIDILFRSAEAFLQTWERTTGER